MRVVVGTCWLVAWLALGHLMAWTNFYGGKSGCQSIEGKNTALAEREQKQNFYTWAQFGYSFNGGLGICDYYDKG